MEKRSYGQVMADTFSSPIVERFQVRSTRRRLVLAMLALTAVEIALVTWMPDLWWVYCPLVLAFFPLASMINMSVRGVTEIPLSHLDDRLAQLRMKAFHDAYYVGVLLALIAGVWSTTLLHSIAGSGEVFLSALRFGVAGAFIVGGVVGLPAMMLAWRLPDEQADEE